MNSIVPLEFRASDATTDARAAPSPIALSLTAAAVVYAALLFAGEKLLNDADTLWHIEAGRWIFSHQAVPKVDPFSHSLVGMPWVAHEWLSECLTAALYDNFGWTGLVIGGSLAGAAAFASLIHVLLKFVAPKVALPAAAFSFALAAPHLTARPHLFAMPLLVLWVSGLVTARAEKRAPSYWLLPLMALWANLHGGFIIGLGVCCALATEASFAAPAPLRVNVARNWGLFTAGAFVASLVTPHGIAGWLFPFHLLSLTYSLGFIDEWHAPDFTRFQPIELWFIGLVLLIAVYRPRPNPIRILLLAGIAYMAVTHARNAELLALIAPLLLAEPLGMAGVRQAAPATPRAGFTIPAMAMGAMAVMSLWVGFGGYDHKDSKVMPAQALAAAREANLTGPVLNSYDFGGYLIFLGIPVFVDGRVDLYGDAFMRDYVRAVADEGDALPRVLEQYHIAWTLLPPHNAAVAALDRMPGWQRIYSDSSAVIHRRVN